MQSALRDHFVSPSTTRVTDWAHIKRSLVQGDWKQRLKIKDNHATLLNDVTDLHLCTGNRKFKTRLLLTLKKWNDLGEEEWATAFEQQFLKGSAPPSGAPDHLNTPEALGWHLGAMGAHTGFPGVIPSLTPSTQPHEAWNKVFTQYFGKIKGTMGYALNTGLPTVLRLCCEHYCSPPQHHVPVVPAHMYVSALQAFQPSATHTTPTCNEVRSQITLPAWPTSCARATMHLCMEGGSQAYLQNPELKVAVQAAATWAIGLEAHQEQDRWRFDVGEPLKGGRPDAGEFHLEFVGRRAAMVSGCTLAGDATELTRLFMKLRDCNLEELNSFLSNQMNAPAAGLKFICLPGDDNIVLPSMTPNAEKRPSTPLNGQVFIREDKLVDCYVCNCSNVLHTQVLDTQLVQDSIAGAAGCRVAAFLIIAAMCMISLQSPR